MMIKIQKGDMFESQYDIRVNTVNCVGVMGAGVALAFKRRYPDMYLAYKEACEKDEIRPGELYVWRQPNNDWIVNFPTKRNWRAKSRYADIASGLLALRQYLAELGGVKVALPALGCGHGGLDWSLVLPMIIKELDDLDAEIHVFEPDNSRTLGHQSSNNNIDHSLLELGDYGFFPAELKQDEKRPANLFFIMGDWNPFSYRWISLFPSKELHHREIEALQSIATQLRSASDSTAVVLLYKVRTSLEVAEIFSKKGINVVLILPFGPLSNLKLIRDIEKTDPKRISVISFAEPKQKWNNLLGISANKFIFENSSGALLSDPSSEVISETNLKKWRYNPFVFVRYREHSPEALSYLSEFGLRPIGRRHDTGELNLAPLLSETNEIQVNIENENSKLSHNVNHSQLNKIAKILENFDSDSYEISFSITTGSEKLKSMVKNIVEEVDATMDS